MYGSQTIFGYGGQRRSRHDGRGRPGRLSARYAAGCPGAAGRGRQSVSAQHRLADGDKLAAVNLAEAAKIMEKNPAALQLRALQTIDGLGPSPSNTVVLFPMELLELVKSFTGGKKEKKE